MLMINNQTPTNILRFKPFTKSSQQKLKRNMQVFALKNDSLQLPVTQNIEETRYYMNYSKEIIRSCNSLQLTSCSE